MVKVINFECIQILNIRATGQALTWESALAQISKAAHCKTVTITLGRLVYHIDWAILANIHESLQLNMPFSVAVGGEVWYIEHYQDVEHLFYNVPVGRLYMRDGVAYYVGDIVGIRREIIENSRSTLYSAIITS